MIHAHAHPPYQGGEISLPVTYVSNSKTCKIHIFLCVSQDGNKEHTSKDKIEKKIKTRAKKREKLTQRGFV